MSAELRIGEVADQAGVNVQTLRYYERRGLVTAARRRPSGHRAYSADAVGLVRMIKAAQRLGFTLTEIEELIKLSTHRRGGTEVLRERAGAKIAEIDQRIAQLQSIRGALAAIRTADCDSLVSCSCGQGCPFPVLELASAGDRRDRRS